MLIEPSRILLPAATHAVNNTHTSGLKPKNQEDYLEIAGFEAYSESAA
jgi:hypothetical protein